MNKHEKVKIANIISVILKTTSGERELSAKAKDNEIILDEPVFLNKDDTVAITYSLETT